MRDLKTINSIDGHRINIKSNLKLSHYKKNQEEAKNNLCLSINSGLSDNILLSNSTNSNQIET